ncbi:MAG: YdcF family protein [Hyphomicrobiaceae bacterium]|nr:YdcF family protein [Hyphomicrobiaceae bacterium]
MTRTVSWLIAITGVGLWLLASGFVLFAVVVMREPVPAVEPADGIVVLTGGDQRIREGAVLLERGLSRRLLITGVNTHTRLQDIAGLRQLPEWQLTCCVDLGYTALDTSGNAEEAGAWARRLHYRSLIVVTSSYHMPRSLVEMARELPETRVLAHPVQPPSFKSGDWWLSPGTLRILLSEYIKLIPATARLVGARLLSRSPTTGFVAVPGDRTTDTAGRPR